MSVIALLLLVALLIPIMGIVVDSPIGRALARRLEGGTREVPPALDDLAKKVDLLEAEVDDLKRGRDTALSDHTRSEEALASALGEVTAQIQDIAAKLNGRPTPPTN